MPARERDIYLYHSVYNDSCVHPAFFFSFFFFDRALVAEVDAWSSAFDLPKGFVVLCLMKHRNNVTFA